MEHSVGKESDCPLPSMFSVEAGGIRILVFRHEDGTFSALEDRCSHADVKLSRGKFEDGVIECAAHGAKFDAKTGQQLCMPAVSPVKKFEVKVRDGEIIVVIP